MAPIPPNSLEEVRIHGEITDDPGTLAADPMRAMSYEDAADAVVRGCSIVYSRVHDLRKLIDAVQAHPDATLAPPKEERGDDWKPHSLASPEALTHLRIHGGEVLSNDCQGLDSRVRLTLSPRFAGRAEFFSARFADGASFRSAHFADAAIFRRAHFEDRADFDSARFADAAIFRRAHFEDRADFDSARFAGWATFGSAHFADAADFDSARFADAASFASAHFAGGADFREAHFEDRATFDSAHFAYRAIFDWARVERALDLRSLRARPKHLSIDALSLEPAASLFLDLEHLQQVERSDPDRLSNWIARMPRGSRRRIAGDIVDRTLSFRRLRHPIRHYLGLGERGDVIEGELADSPATPKAMDEVDNAGVAKALQSAEQQYRILRDNFRNQPSAEEHEDICHFRYMDLKRRALWWKATTIREKVKLGLEWLVMRNMLGYMIYPGRIVWTGFTLFAVCALLFGLFAGPNTITHGGLVDPVALWKSDWLNPIYFSLMTFVTLGYGDFAPLGWFKLLCGIEGLLGVTLLALFTVAWGRRMIR